MKKKILLIGSLICMTALFSSCEKHCLCYRFDGGHDIFTQEELNQQDMTCTHMESVQMGLIYSLCEWSYKDY